MAEQPKQPMPRSIFEAINMNIVDLSKDLVAMYQKVDAIYNVLFPPQPMAEPDVPGAAEEKISQ